jgi:NADH:ubiquinone oxidoreductase subunit E
MDNNKTDNILKLLQKENETLKKIIKEKHIQNDSLTALLEILDLQRHQINYLEEGSLLFI